MLFFLGLLTACQNKKYDPLSYKEGAAANDSSGNDYHLSKLRGECLTLMNYCDKNKTLDIKKFARDWIRTWEGWETDGVNEYTGVKSCHINTKNRYNVKAIYVSVYTDSNPPVFKVERPFFKTEYNDLVEMVRDEFGNPSEENNSTYGTIYKWYVDKTKTILTIPDHFSNKFAIKYKLTN